MLLRSEAPAQLADLIICFIPKRAGGDQTHRTNLLQHQGAEQMASAVLWRAIEKAEHQAFRSWFQGSGHSGDAVEAGHRRGVRAGLEENDHQRDAGP